MSRSRQLLRGPFGGVLDVFSNVDERYPNACLLHNTVSRSYTESQMTDEVGGTNVFHGCNHTKFTPPVFSGSLSVDSDFDFTKHTDGQRIALHMPLKGHTETRYTSWPCTDPGTMPANPEKPGSPPWNELTSELGESVEGHMESKTNILENIATLGQTIRMVKQPLQSCRRVISSLTNGRRLSAADYLSSGASTWMEYRYGWNPIRYSFKAISEAWKKAEDHIRYLRSVRGKWSDRAARRSYSYTYPDDATVQGWLRDPILYATSNPSSRLVNLSRSTVYTVSCDLYTQPGVKILSQMDYAKEYLHADSLYDVLWELLPYSFVVDWLINVDLLLAALTFSRLTRPDVRRLGYSTKEEWTFHWAILAATGGMGSSYYCNHRFCPSVFFTQDFKKSQYVRTGGFAAGSSMSGYFGSGVNIVHGVDATALFILGHHH